VKYVLTKYPITVERIAPMTLKSALSTSRELPTAAYGEKHFNCVSARWQRSKAL